MSKVKLDTLFNIINRDIFKNELEIPIFAIHYMPDMYGFHTQWDGQHIISLRAEDDFYTQSRTLAHEMIHQWQLDNGYKRNHGKRFQKMARRIEKHYNLREGDI